jgi:hypothetical protein
MDRRKVAPEPEALKDAPMLASLHPPGNLDCAKRGIRLMSGREE